MTAEEYHALILSFLASLCLCDHMGDVSNDVSEVLKRIGLGNLEFDDFDDLGDRFAEMGILTLNGISLKREDDDIRGDEFAREE